VVGLDYITCNQVSNPKPNHNSKPNLTPKPTKKHSNKTIIIFFGFKSDKSLKSIKSIKSVKSQSSTYPKILELIDGLGRTRLPFYASIYRSRKRISEGKLTFSAVIIDEEIFFYKQYYFGGLQIPYVMTLAGKVCRESSRRIG